MTEIGRTSVAMYVSDQFIVRKLQLTVYRDPSTKLGFWVGRILKRQKNDLNSPKNAKMEWRPLANDPRTKGKDENVRETE